MYNLEWIAGLGSDQWLYLLVQRQSDVLYHLVEEDSTAPLTIWFCPKLNPDLVKPSYPIYRKHRGQRNMLLDTVGAISKSQMVGNSKKKNQVFWTNSKKRMEAKSYKLKRLSTSYNSRTLSDSWFKQVEKLNIHESKAFEIIGNVNTAWVLRMFRKER